MPKYRHGNVLMVDYTPDAAVSAGDVVVIGSECRIAHLDIEAGQLGALAAPAGTAIYEGTKATGGSTSFADGDPVYWDAENERVSNVAGAKPRIGTAVADAADAASTVLFRHHAAPESDEPLPTTTAAPTTTSG